MENPSDSSLPRPQTFCVLRAARILAGMSQVRLGQLIGRSNSWVSRVESGEIDASPTEQAKIAEALGVPSSVIFADEEAEHIGN